MPFPKAPLLLVVGAALFAAALTPFAQAGDAHRAAVAAEDYSDYYRERRYARYDAAETRLNGVLIGDGLSGTISTAINGLNCNLQAHFEAGTPNTVGKDEHLAKFNCTKQGNIFFRRGDRLYTVINGRECGLQIDADAGTPDTLFPHEHVAKFDCRPRADAMIFEKNKIYALFGGEKCGLQWDSDTGSPPILEKNEHVAKFDCKNRGRYLTFTENLDDEQVSEEALYRSARVVSVEL